VTDGVAKKNFFVFPSISLLGGGCIWANAKILPYHEHALWNSSPAWTAINIPYASMALYEKTSVNCANGGASGGAAESSGGTISTRLSRGCSLQPARFLVGAGDHRKRYVYPMVIIRWPKGYQNDAVRFYGTAVVRLAVRGRVPVPWALVVWSTRLKPIQRPAVTALCWGRTGKRCGTNWRRARTGTSYYALRAQSTMGTRYPRNDQANQPRRHHH
jgi:hypothetical protein